MVFRFVLVAVLLSVLSGCGGDDEAFGFRPRAGNTGSINLYVTDAPIDYATEVVLTFTGVVLERAEGDPVHLRVQPARSINLLSLQWGNRAQLLDDVTVPAGEYESLRLLVLADVQTTDSYVGFVDGSLASLYVPRGEDVGLEIRGGIHRIRRRHNRFCGGFRPAPRPGAPSRHSGLPALPLPTLRPRRQHGRLQGRVPYGFLTGPNCDNGLNHDTGNAVFLFQGDEISGNSEDVVASGSVRLDPDSGHYTYFIDVLPSGRYTVAFTCRAADRHYDGFVLTEFRRGGVIDVVPGTTAVFNFPEDGVEPDENDSGFFGSES